MVVSWCGEEQGSVDGFGVVLVLTEATRRLGHAVHLHEITVAQHLVKPASGARNHVRLRRAKVSESDRETLRRVQARARAQGCEACREAEATKVSSRAASSTWARGVSLSAMCIVLAHHCRRGDHRPPAGVRRPAAVPLRGPWA